MTDRASDTPRTDDSPAAPAAYQPYVPPVSTAPQAVMVPLGLSDPLRWLRLGWRDFLAAPGIGLFYGVCFWLMAVVLTLVFRNKPEYVMSIASGCLLIGPFLAMGRASLVVFAVFFNTGMPSTTGVLQAIFNPDNIEFVLVYLMVGGIFALLVYSTAVVSIPMILDRDTDAISAAITSIRVVFANPITMLWWGFLITLLIAIGLATWGVGLIIIGPLLGHASWHAYRGAVRWQEPAAAA